MNQQESLALFANGRDAWNAWAERMLDARAALEADGNWVEGRSEPELNAATRAWHAAAAADFSKCTFQEPADFSGFVFPGRAGFGGASFSGDARFVGVRLGGSALDRRRWRGAARLRRGAGRALGGRDHPVDP